MINTYDIDGVIYMGEAYIGLTPLPTDIIITGRSIEEADVTLQYLKNRNIHNKVYFNPLSFDNKSRITSGYHKVKILKALLDDGYKIGIHFEDDPIQIEIIEQANLSIQVVKIMHNLIPKENFRHGTV